MSTLSQFGGTRSTKSIVNGCSSSGYAAINLNSIPGSVRLLNSGALTANTLKTILNVSGAGIFHVLGARTNDATIRTVRMRLTIDGTVVFDSTSAAAGANTGGLITGSSNGTTPLPGATVVFNSSAVFEIASSLTETDTISTLYVLEGK
jgi:hypothetical protein